MLHKNKKIKHLETIYGLLESLKHACKQIRKYSLRESDSGTIDFAKRYLDEILVIIQNTHDEIENASGAYTNDEFVELLMKQIRGRMKYAGEQHPHNGKEAAELAVFSILTLLDGATCDIPSFKLIPNIDEEYIQYCKTHDQRWIPLNAVIDTELHEMLYTKE